MIPPKPLDVMDLARPTCHEQKTNTQNHWVFLYAFLHLPFSHDPNVDAYHINHALI